MGLLLGIVADRQGIALAGARGVAQDVERRAGVYVAALLGESSALAAHELSGLEPLAVFLDLALLQRELGTALCLLLVEQRHLPLVIRCRDLLSRLLGLPSSRQDRTARRGGQRCSS